MSDLGFLLFLKIKVRILGVYMVWSMLAIASLEWA